MIGVAIFLPSGHLGIFSLGYDDLTHGLNNELTWRLAALLLAGKLAATVVGYGTGGCGGHLSRRTFSSGRCAGRRSPVSPARRAST